VTEKHKEQIQTAVRLPKSLLSDVDKLANQMSSPGVHATRSEALRFALRHGVNDLLLPKHTKPKSKKR
jgi:Arc/MetJ-type ribon-helix-helix transcriptional regulator